MTKVLIVDDEPQYGVYLRDWLVREGHEVKTTTTAEDAIDYGTHWLPSVLVADWMLRSPLNGLQVSEAVRAANPKMQTILITGYPSPELKARAEEANVFSFIEKPFSLTEVAGAVRQAANLGRPLLPGSILIVSASSTIIQSSRDDLRAASYKTHLAANSQQAQRIVREDPTVTIAVLDCIAPGIDDGILADELREVRRNLIVVGSSEGDDRDRFKELGIDRFLPRFWDAAGLHELLIERIATCSGCGLALPLRRLLPCDSVQSWECSECAARYQGAIVDDAPDDVRRNVRTATG